MIDWYEVIKKEKDEKRKELLREAMREMEELRLTLRSKELEVKELKLKVQDLAEEVVYG